MKRKLGAKKQPNVPNTIVTIPSNNSLFKLYLTLKTPSNTPKTIETMPEIVTNWPVVAKKTGSEEPKNVVAISI